MTNNLFFQIETFITYLKKSTITVIINQTTNITTIWQAITSRKNS